MGINTKIFDKNSSKISISSQVVDILVAAGPKTTSGIFLLFLKHVMSTIVPKGIFQRTLLIILWPQRGIQYQTSLESPISQDTWLETFPGKGQTLISQK